MELKKRNILFSDNNMPYEDKHIHTHIKKKIKQGLNACANVNG